MKSLLVFSILFLGIVCLPTELNLPVRPDTQQKLSLALQRLTEELQYFRTPFENKSNLYKRVTLTEQYLQQLNSQVSEYENVIRGKQNKIVGSKNVIVGSFNTLRGNNNYVFIEKYTGQANGDLLIGKWRIQIEKKKSILVNSSAAISFINEETNRKYLRYLTQNRKFTLGSASGSTTVTVVKEDEGPSTNSYNYGLNEIGQKNVGEQTIRNSEQQSFVRSQALSNGNLSQSSISPVLLSRQSLTPQSLIGDPATQPSLASLPEQSVIIGSNDPSSVSNILLPNSKLQSTKYKNALSGLNQLQQRESLNVNLRSQTQPSQSELRTSLGYPSNTPSQQNGNIFSTFNSQDKVAKTTPSPSEPVPINLATWRNRS